MDAFAFSRGVASFREEYREFFKGEQPFDVRTDSQVARFLQAVALSTNAHLEQTNGAATYNVVGDTTEGALMIAAQKVGWTREQLERDMPRVAELPFSSERKAMTTVHKVDPAGEFCNSKMSLSVPSNRSAHTCMPLEASITWPVIRTLLPAFLKLPSRT